ncbi:hypothetical protein H4R35_001452 [Dimargaris xerosporica]|nr:hypothetical protein H4R35_001452 [Dimargaris xerosporica]
MSSRLLASAQAQIAAGEYYEAHQKLRTLANRYMKTGAASGPSEANVQKTIDLLCGGASALLDQGQTSSAADLMLYVLDIYNKHRVSSGGAHKSAKLLSDQYHADKQRICQLLTKLPPSKEPLAAGIVKALVKWSVRCQRELWALDLVAQDITLADQSISNPPPAVLAGDADLHHFLGTLFTNDGEYERAEYHLLLGTAESARVLAKALHQWSQVATLELVDSGIYAARGTLQYLALNKPHSAYVFWDTYLGLLRGDTSAKSPHINDGPDPLTVRHEGSTIVNFCQLLLLAVERRGRDAFVKLRTDYPVEWGKSRDAVDQLLDVIGECHFGITVPKQGNPLQDIMKAFFAPGSGGAGGNAALPF